MAPSAYVVLGLLEVNGPGTPYDLKRWVDESIGYFWTFPRAQLYVEPARLAGKGLVEEERESEGRRRRVYGITEAGREALREWLREGSPGSGQGRDPGLLKLYFSTVSSPREVIALARKELAAHEARLAQYQAIRPHLEQHPRGVFALATLRVGEMVERGMIEFWSDIAKNPPALQRNSFRRPPKSRSGTR
jgi:PadR family transcriptional regulator AphA